MTYDPEDCIKYIKYLITLAVLTKLLCLCPFSSVPPSSRISPHQISSLKSGIASDNDNKVNYIDK